MRVPGNSARRLALLKKPALPGGRSIKIRKRGRMHSSYHPEPRAQDSRRLRVLTLVDSSRGLGGGGLIASRVAMLLNPSRFERILCWTRPSSGSVADQLSAAGVRVLSLERRSRAALQAWLPLISLVRRERVDIIHAHKFGSNIWGTLV